MRLQQTANVPCQRSNELQYKHRSHGCLAGADTMSVAMRIVNRCFADAERLHRGEAGLSKLIQEIQRVALKRGGWLTHQDLRAHGSLLIRQLRAKDFKELVAVMVSQGLGA